MIQYCRYCAYMVCGDFNYCEIKEKFYRESTIKVPNKCKNFAFCELDALQENLEPYKPRKKKENNYHQIDIYEVLKNE